MTLPEEVVDDIHGDLDILEVSPIQSNVVNNIRIAFPVHTQFLLGVSVEVIALQQVGQFVLVVELSSICLSNVLQSTLGHQETNVGFQSGEVRKGGFQVQQVFIVFTGKHFILQGLVVSGESTMDIFLGKSSGHVVMEQAYFFEKHF